MTQGSTERVRGPGHLGNAGWSTAEYVFYPLLMLAATPVYVALLGVTDYGLWMLVLAITGFGTAANLGMGTATIKFVAACRGRGDADRVAATVRQTLSIAILGGASFALVLCLLSSWLAHHVFGQMGSPAKVEQTLFIAASLLLVQQFDVVFAAALKGMERFDIAARMEILIRLVTVAACVAAAWLTRDLLVVLLTYLASACFALVFRGVVAGRLVGGFVLLPAWSRERAGEVFSFGMWSSLQGLAAALFQNADRMIIGAYLGAGPVAYFSVCTQLAQQIHTIPAAAMSVLLPLVSRKSAGPAGGLRRVRRLSVLLNFMFAGVLALALFVIGPAFLVWWMGSEFAAQTGNLLTWLVLGYFVLALAVAPHFLLLGRGEARFVSLSNIVGGIATLLSALVLIPVAGLVGAAWSRLAYGPVLAVSFARLYGKTAP